MATMTVSIDNYADINSIATVAHNLKGVSELEIQERKKKKKFQEACIECNAVPLDTFIAELKTSVKEYFSHA